MFWLNGKLNESPELMQILRKSSGLLKALRQSITEAVGRINASHCIGGGRLRKRTKLDCVRKTFFQGCIERDIYQERNFVSQQKITESHTVCWPLEVCLEWGTGLVTESHILIPNQNHIYRSLIPNFEWFTFLFSRYLKNNFWHLGTARTQTGYVSSFGHPTRSSIIWATWLDAGMQTQLWHPWEKRTCSTLQPARGWLSLCSSRVIKLKGDVRSLERGQRTGTERNKHLRNHPEGASWKDVGVLVWPAAVVRPVLGNEEASLMAWRAHKTRDNGFGGYCEISKEIWVCQPSQCMSKGNYRWPFPNTSPRSRIIRYNTVSKDKLATGRRWSFISTLRSQLLRCDSVTWCDHCSVIPWFHVGICYFTNVKCVHSWVSEREQVCTCRCEYVRAYVYEGA